MKSSGKAARWPRTANPVLAAMRRKNAKRLDKTMMDIQAAEAVASLRSGHLAGFDAKVLEGLVFVVRRLARQGIGPEALPCAERCLALLNAIQAGQVPSTDQVACFFDLIGFSQAQREADLDAFRASVMPFVR